MLPLLVLHGNQTNGKRKRTLEAVEYAITRHKTGDPNPMMRNALELTKDAIDFLEMQNNASNHMAHYVYNLKADSVFETMLITHYYTKKQSPSYTPQKIHEENRLVWMANVAGKRGSSTKQQGAISKAESLVKKAVALERLHEAYTTQRDGTNTAVTFLNRLHIEMKEFNDGAVEFLSTTPTTKNNPMWFAKYRMMAWNDPTWM